MNIRSLIREPFILITILLWIIVTIGAIKIPHHLKILAGDNWWPYPGVLFYIGLFGAAITTTIVTVIPLLVQKIGGKK